MGCSASRLDTLLAKAIEDPSSLSSNTTTSTSSSGDSSNTKKPSNIPKTRSLTAPLVHHPAINKGDTHHLVCLTSSTYGSLVIVDKHPSSSSTFSSPTTTTKENDFEKISSISSPDSVINTWELMEGLEGENGIDSEAGKGSKFTSLINSCDFNVTQKKTTSKLGFSCDFDETQKKPTSKMGFSCVVDDAQKNPSSKLGLSLNDYGESFKLGMLNTSGFDDAQKKPISKLGLKLSDSYVFVEVPKEEVGEKGLDVPSNSSKPLWKHLSEESLLSKMDPNVASSYQRALSTNKLGYDQPMRMTKSMGSSPIVPKSKSLGSSFVVPKLSNDKDNDNDNGCKVPRPEDKIVLYFTSLRGIRRTYEDCCTVRMILRGFRVVVDEKDISMDSNYRKEMQSALGGNAVSLPQLFIGGKHIGGADEIKQLHEAGELGRLLDGFPIQDRGFVCESCDESRFVPCSNCNGSRKVFEEEEGRMKRCPECNENGLIRCPVCFA